MAAKKGAAKISAARKTAKTATAKKAAVKKAARPSLSSLPGDPAVLPGNPIIDED